MFIYKLPSRPQVYVAQEGGKSAVGQTHSLALRNYMRMHKPGERCILKKS